MEMMPHHHPEEVAARHSDGALLAAFEPVATTDWRAGLPVLAGPQCTLRELQLDDAPSLLAHLTTEEVSRFISPPPTTVAGFEDFIRWTHLRRSQGRHVCFGIVPEGQTQAVGMFQIRVPDPGQPIAEWGFVLGAAYWGTGIFLTCARRVIDFAFGRMGIRRLEARSVLQNGRGNGALRKVGAVRETVLRGSFERHGERFDQALWTIARDDWWATLPMSSTVH
jgi:ribosomal-protein-alanine N-acetyltransferase